jgi:RNA polymerase sigma-70 factor (ECF subfamily)
MALDRAQFEELFSAERDRVFRFLYRLTGNAADADDLLQEAFLTTWRHRSQFDGRGSAAGWLLRTAFRLYLNWRRKGTRRVRLAGRVEPLAVDPAAPASVARNGSAHGPDADEARRFLLERVRGALSSLPDDARTAFVMFRFEGIPVAEIAAIADCPPKTVETRIRRATLLLAASLSGLREHLPTP